VHRAPSGPRLGAVTARQPSPAPAARRPAPPLHLLLTPAARCRRFGRAPPGAATAPAPVPAARRPGAVTAPRGSRFRPRAAQRRSGPAPPPALLPRPRWRAISAQEFDAIAFWQCILLPSFEPIVTRRAILTVVVAKISTQWA